jgi:hypothetical protein
MLRNNPIGPETERRRALAKVYTLLIRLAEEESERKTVNVQPLVGETLTVERKTSTKEGDQP